jgi:hypothetical protein
MLLTCAVLRVHLRKDFLVFIALWNHTDPSRTRL